MGYFYSEILLLPNENQVLHFNHFFVLLQIIKRFSKYYKVRINEFALSCSSFKIIFYCRNLAIARKFLSSIKKNYNYWSTRFFNTKGCMKVRSEVVQLHDKESVIQCVLEVLRLSVLQQCAVSSYLSHYSFRNLIFINSKSCKEWNYYYLVMSKARSSVNSSSAEEENPHFKRKNYLDLSAFLNIDTLLIDSTFSFKTFQEIVNLQTK